VVYVQEAHPTDGWQVESNVAEEVLFRQHQRYTEREAVATTCSLDLHLSIPVLVEEMNNAIDEAYGAAPERLYLIGVDGCVAYITGAPGPTSLTWRPGNRPLLPVCAPWQRRSVCPASVCCIRKGDPTPRKRAREGFAGSQGSESRRSVTDRGASDQPRAPSTAPDAVRAAGRQQPTGTGATRQ
jgi:hypothetical protein